MNTEEDKTDGDRGQNKVASEHTYALQGTWPRWHQHCTLQKRLDNYLTEVFKGSLATGHIPIPWGEE